MMTNLLRKSVLGLAFALCFHVAALGQTNNSNVPSQAGALRVNTPTANQQISQNFIHVTYQLVNPGAAPAPSPNFTVQLDGNDPVTTTALDYTFTGLTPGTHTITVTLVDANGVPIANSSVATKFVVVNPNRGTGSPASSLHRRSHVQLASSEVVSLPFGSTPLPILSLMGFAVLVGGITTAIRNR